jgi:hypothetical protein
MTRRSLTRLFIVNLLTLGFYEYVWLSQTRQEMVSKYNASIPRIKWLLLLYFLQLVALIGILFAVVHFIPRYNQQLDAITRPSPQCIIDYAKNSDEVRQGQAASVSQSCKQSVDNYYSQTDKVDRRMNYAVGAMIVCVVFIIINPVFYARWFSYYSRAVEQVTGGKISQNLAMLLFFFTPPSLGMVLIQNTFNQLSAETDSQQL